MKLDSGVSNTLKEERKLGEAKSKGHSALRGELKRLKKKEEHGESVRGWKKKNIYIYIYFFFFTQVTHKKDKLVEFSWNFWVLQP